MEVLGISGHGDVTMGCLAYNKDYLEEKFSSHISMNGCGPSPFDCFLVNRSLPTLELRMKKHMSNGLAVARFLEQHPRVKSVNHPGLSSHPQHMLASKLMKGYPGVFSFYLSGSYENSRSFLLNLKVFTISAGIGTYKSYASLPCMLTHRHIPEEDKRKIGITENLIRLSVGLEDSYDLITDLDQAFSALTQTTEAALILNN